MEQGSDNPADKGKDVREEDETLIQAENEEAEQDQVTARNLKEEADGLGVLLQNVVSLSRAPIEVLDTEEAQAIYEAIQICREQVQFCSASATS